MSEPFIGEIRMFGFTFAPRGWANCSGQIMSIAQNTALFSLINTYYGGNGQTTFALPDMRGRVSVNQGQGPGLSPYSIGQTGGVESVTLNTNQMPMHNHLVSASSSPSNATRPGNAFPGGNGAYQTASDGTTMAPQMIGIAGGSQPHPNLQPYIAINFCIALEGIFPSRN